MQSKSSHEMPSEDLYLKPYNKETGHHYSSSSWQGERLSNKVAFNFHLPMSIHGNNSFTQDRFAIVYPLPFAYSFIRHSYYLK